MAHPLEALLVLQEKDRRLIKLRREMRDIPSRKADVETQLEQAKSKLAAARADQMKVQSDLKQLEVEVECHREKIDRYKNQQMEAKNNDQYRALLSEVATEEKGISELEDREIEFMEQLEASKKDISSTEEELKEEEEAISEELEMLTERLSEIQEDIESRMASRERDAGNVDAGLLVKYTRLLANKGDFAVVRVENSHCRGCNMKLPPQVVNDALNPAKLVICNFCGRMLVNL